MPHKRNFIMRFYYHFASFPCHWKHLHQLNVTEKRNSWFYSKVAHWVTIRSIIDLLCMLHFKTKGPELWKNTKASLPYTSLCSGLHMSLHDRSNKQCNCMGDSITIKAQSICQIIKFLKMVNQTWAPKLITKNSCQTVWLIPLQPAPRVTNQTHQKDQRNTNAGVWATIQAFP